MCFYFQSCAFVIKEKRCCLEEDKHTQGKRKTIAETGLSDSWTSRLFPDMVELQVLYTSDLVIPHTCGHLSQSLEMVAVLAEPGLDIPQSL